MSPVPLLRRVVAEFIGTALLLAIIGGSGIMAERLSGGNAAIALLANTMATGAGLVALIITFGPLSGAHFNPLVTLSAAAGRKLPWSAVGPYLSAQFIGGIVGILIAHAMFDAHLISWSQHERSGISQAFSEFVATFGLLAVIHGCGRHRPAAIPFAVGAYITAAYWFTASTSFANPAVTLARCFSDTFAGIRPIDVPLFMLAQVSGALTADMLFRWLLGSSSPAPAPAGVPIHLLVIASAVAAEPTTSTPVRTPP